MAAVFSERDEDPMLVTLREAATQGIVLSARQEARRQKLLRRMTGVPYPTLYRFFRGLIMLLGRPFVSVQVVGDWRLPQGDLDYRPGWYRRNAKRFNRFDSGAFILVVGPHTSTFDILCVGRFRRGLIWICKYGFTNGYVRRWMNPPNGAFAVLRPSDLRLEGRGLRRWLSKRRAIKALGCTYHTFDEWSRPARRALDRGEPAMMFLHGKRGGEKAKSGPARLALATGKPVVVMAISGLNGLSLRDWLRHPGARRVRVTFSDPIRPNNQSLDLGDGWEGVIQLTRLIDQTLVELLELAPGSS